MLDAAPCVSEDNCPAVFELADGRIAVIGSVEAVALPDGVSVGPGEALVVVPRDVLDKALPGLSEVNDIQATGECCCNGCIGMGPCDLDPRDGDDDRWDEDEEVWD